MGANTSIEWATHTFNPWEGCVKVSAECDHCYASVRDNRLHSGDNWGRDAGRLHHAEAYWKQPGKWNRDARLAGRVENVFCGSLCDIMEDRADLTSNRARALRIAAETEWLNWLFLTKRPQNFNRFVEEVFRNFWFGTTVGVRKSLWRIEDLRGTVAPVKFLSVEPLLEDLGTIDLAGISWLIVGAESGPGARGMHFNWVRSLRDQCIAAGVAFFFKQDAIHGIKKPAPYLDGRQWLEFPQPSKLAPARAKG